MNFKKNIWHNLSNPPGLKYGEVHIWRVFVNQKVSELPTLFETLSLDERKKADRFHFEKDRRQFIVARGTLRKILGAYLDISPSEISFSYNHFGKPMLNNVKDKHLLCFNVSHSNGILLVAVTNGQEVGIDIEFINEESATLKVAGKFCSPNEFSVLSSKTADLKVAAFYSLWTRKEAFVKAIGEGLSDSLKQIKLPIISEERETYLNETFSHRIGKWSVVNLPSDAEYVASLVVKGAIKTIRCWQFLES